MTATYSPADEATVIIARLPKRPEYTDDYETNKRILRAWQRKIVRSLNALPCPSTEVAHHMERIGYRTTVGSWAEFVRQYGTDYPNAARDIAVTGKGHPSDSEEGYYYEIAKLISENL